jgi:predicted secreted Zn-dependent protease
MSQRSHLEDETHPVRALQAAAKRDEELTPHIALDAARDPGLADRGGSPVVARALDGLQATAGNRAVVSLVDGRTRSLGRQRRASVNAGRAAVLDVQRAAGDDDEKPTDSPTDANANAMDPTLLTAGSDTTDPTGSTNVAGSGDQDAVPTGSGAPTPGASWTKVGPVANSTYAVSGSLRSVANAIAARTEAGSVTSTPSQDTETYAPDGGTEKVTAARVTVTQAMELPSWTDKANATKGQQAEWDRFFGALTTHENGHVTLDKTAYGAVHAKMLGQTPKDADAKLDAAEAKAKADNATYDTTTGHGVKQGTGINPNIDEVTKVP